MRVRNVGTTHPVPSPQAPEARRGNRGTGRSPGGPALAVASRSPQLRGGRGPRPRPPADSRRPHLALGLPAPRAAPSRPGPPCAGPENAAPPPAPTGIIAAPSAAPSPPDRTPLRPLHRPRARCGALRPGCGKTEAAESRAALARPVAPPRVPRRRPSAAAAATAEAGRLPPPARLTPQAAQAPPHAPPPPAYATSDWSGEGGGLKRAWLIRCGQVRARSCASAL